MATDGGVAVMKKMRGREKGGEGREGGKGRGGEGEGEGRKRSTYGSSSRHFLNSLLRGWI